MTRIVCTAYRYKRPLRKRQAAALEVPAVVKAAEPAKARKRVAAADKPLTMSGGSEPVSDQGGGKRRVGIAGSARRDSRPGPLHCHYHPSPPHRHQSHWRLTMPGNGSHGAALTARASCSSYQAGRAFSILSAPPSGFEAPA
jgi:hypothetical protein